MNNIIEPDESFDFSLISLSHPSSIQGGAYFTRIEYNKKPLYIQTTKSLSKQGVVKSGKKYYCELMFDKTSIQIINWFENLEDTCKKLLFEKSENWFENNLEQNDIESAFNPSIRIYKSGKFYLLRTNIKTNSGDNTPSVKIYNENEVTLSTSDITTESNMISILEIQGIKFTSRNFQLEIELKQIMVLDDEKIFENCIIKREKKRETLGGAKGDVELKSEDIGEIQEIIDTNTLDEPEVVAEDIETLGELMVESELEIEPQTENLEEPKTEDNITLEIEDLSPLEEKQEDELREVDIPFNNNDDSLTLKKPNQVYFELYKQARIKAKQAKKSAILAYLEAKNIKKTYMIDSMDDSDSEFDAEIDETSESELEGLENV